MDPHTNGTLMRHLPKRTDDAFRPGVIEITVAFADDFGSTALPAGVSLLRLS
jgi:hypothetical protein